MSLAYHDAAHWYFSFARFEHSSPRSDELKLVRMNEILAHLDNPHHKFPSILIAGTKGKGSTAALLASVLREAGYRTGLFTSPHLHSFRERVRINGEFISQERVVEITERLQEIQSHFPISTYFEWVTALAFTHFAREQVDIAVVEVGLGGRLDCTNVLTPRVSVITPISFDHMDILGDTLQKIASEKAGIIKPKTPVVVAPQKFSAWREIHRRAAELQAPVVDVDKTWQWELIQAAPESQTVHMRHATSGRWQLFQLPLLGPHQRVNLATALATIDVMHRRNWRISTQSITEGVAGVQWFARFEVLTGGPHPQPLSQRERGAKQAGERGVEQAGGEGVEIVVDGAHNRASAHELVRTLDEVFPDARVHFIFGASSDKDIAGMLAELAPRACSFIFTQAHHARAALPETLAELASSYQLETHTAPGVGDALEMAKRIARSKEVVCVTGSLFIAAEAREKILHLAHDG